MAIRVVEDLGAPLAVTAVDLVTETAAPEWNEWASYIMAGGGFVGAWMGWGGPFLKNVGIASLPWAAKKIYERVRGGVSHKISYSPRRVTRYPAPAEQSPYQGIRLT